MAEKVEIAVEHNCVLDIEIKSMVEWQELPLLDRDAVLVYTVCIIVGAGGQIEIGVDKVHLVGRVHIG